jgi:hypothetical protein
MKHQAQQDMIEHQRMESKVVGLKTQLAQSQQNDMSGLVQE